MELTFNIIFIPGTVRYLRLAILSLLESSPYHYRLVSNGLQMEELLMLKSFCQTSPRLEFYAYPTHKILLHGIILALLERQQKNDYFCFMDPDIFATDPFSSELEEYLGDCDVFSSCNFIGRLPDERPRGFSAHCLQTPNGLPLATTFFSVYRTKLLRKVIEEAGISFERYPSPEHIPDHVLPWLEEMGVEIHKCDTGKLMNILANRFKLRFKHRSIGALYHIGGVSESLLLLNSKKLKKGLWSRVLSLSKMDNHGLNGSEQKIKNPLRKARIETADFFAAYLKWLFGEGEKPVRKLIDLQPDQQVQRLCEVIRNLHKQYQHFL